MRIIQNQTEEDSFIYWNDDPVIKKELEKFDVRAVQYPFSELKEKGSIGYIEEGQYTIEEPTPFNMEQESLSLTGKHNIYNSLAAGIASNISGIKKEDIRKSLSNFPGVEHRLEKVCKVAGVQYINDSKATNVDACWYALESMKTPTILILGGKDKGNDYSHITELVKQKCVGLEDSFNGLRAVRASGAFTLGLATTNSHEAIAPFSDYVIDDYQDFGYEDLCKVVDERGKK